MNEIKPDRVIRSRRRTLALEITPDARLIVRAPLGLPARSVEDFLKSKSPWITTRQRIARENFQRSQPKAFEEGVEFPYLGSSYPLMFSRSGVPLLLENGILLMSRSDGREREILTGWYKSRAAAVFRERLDFYSDRTGLRCQRLKLSNAACRWGSCSVKGSILMNWRLILAPVKIIDYVAVHELVHLEIKNHSFRFWRRLGEILPDYSARRRWLKTNGFLLNY